MRMEPARGIAPLWKGSAVLRVSYSAKPASRVASQFHDIKHYGKYCSQQNLTVSKLLPENIGSSQTYLITANGKSWDYT